MDRPRRNGQPRGCAVLLTALVALLISVVLPAAGASAAVLTDHAPRSAAAPSVLCGYPQSVTRQSDGTEKVVVCNGGGTHYCYVGDACVWRGSWAAYYKCQTVRNTYSQQGFIVNNQTGGANVTLYDYRGYTYTNPPYPKAGWVSNWNWAVMTKFRTC
jgi:hypothetical protein